MATPKLNILAAGIPRGPLGARKGAAPQGRPTTGRPKADHRSKKGYTGTRAGLGRQPNGTVARSGPKGPRAFAGSVQLPNRVGVRHDAVEFHPAATAGRTPSLMTRIGEKLRRTAAAIGL